MDQHQPGSSARRLVRDGFQKLTLQSKTLGLVLLAGYALVFLSQNVFHTSTVVDNLGLVAGRTIPFGYNVVTYAFVEDSFLSVRYCCSFPSHDDGVDHIGDGCSCYGPCRQQSLSSMHSILFKDLREQERLFS